MRNSSSFGDRLNASAAFWISIGIDAFSSFLRFSEIHFTACRKFSPFGIIVDIFFLLYFIDPNIGSHYLAVVGFTEGLYETPVNDIEARVRLCRLLTHYRIQRYFQWVVLKVRHHFERAFLTRISFRVD